MMSSTRSGVRLGLLAWTFFVSTPPTAANDSDSAAFRGTTAYYVLKTAPSFGHGSWRTFAFRLALRQPYADALFKDLLEHATLSGQLYGLCGLWFTDQGSFHRRLEQYQYRDDQIERGDNNGVGICGNTFDRPMREFIVREGRSVIRLDGPHDSVEDWCTRTGRKVSYRDYDFLGGGWPAALARSSELPLSQETDPLDELFRRDLEAGFVPQAADPSREDEHRWRYARVLRRYDHAPPAVVAALEDERPEVRMATLEALSASGPLAADLAERIAAAAFATERRLRWNARNTLLAIGPWAGRCWPVIFERIETDGGADRDARRLSEDQQNEREFARFLTSLVSRASIEDLRHMRRLLAHRDNRIRTWALKGFRSAPELSSSLLSEVERLLRDPVDDVRIAASAALARLATAEMGNLSMPAVELMLTAFENDPVEDVRLNAAIVLGAHGESASSALPALTAALRETSAAVQVAAAHARWSIDGSGPDSVPMLLANLASRTTKSDARTRALEVLSNLAAQEVVAEELSGWLRRDPDGIGRVELVRALGRARRMERPLEERSPLLASLREISAHDDLRVATHAADALYDFTGEPDLAVGLWIEYYYEREESGDGYNSIRALQALMRFGPQAQPASEIVTKILSGGSEPVRYPFARQLLQAIGPAADADAIEAYLTWMEQQRGRWILPEIVKTAGTLGAAARKTLPFLIQLLDHERLEVREASRRAIEDIIAALGEEDFPAAPLAPESSVSRERLRS